MLKLVEINIVVKYTLKYPRAPPPMPFYSLGVNEGVGNCPFLYPIEAFANNKNCIQNLPRYNVKV